MAPAARYRQDLPQLKDGEKLFLVDGGLETHLVFHHGIDLPCFASFTQLKDEEGKDRLKKYFKKFAQMALDSNLNFILEAPTWRGSRDWGAQCGYSVDDMEKANKVAIELLLEIRNEMEGPGFEPGTSKIIVAGRLGPRYEGYYPNKHPRMTTSEAEEYHSQQINWFAQTEADMVIMLTVSYCEEVIGAVKAAQKAGIPIAISFTVETDGDLPSGIRLRDAVETIDAATDSGPVYYLINCAHPSHFGHAFDEGGAWKTRFRGFQPNASRRSHAELEASEALDEGDAEEFGRLVAGLRKKMPWVNVLGGCCGTHVQHIQNICKNLLN